MNYKMKNDNITINGPSELELDTEIDPEVEVETDAGADQDNGLSDDSDSINDDTINDDDDDDGDEDDDDNDDGTSIYKDLGDKKVDNDDKLGKKSIFDSEKTAYNKYDHEVEDLDESDFNKFNDDFKKNHILNFHNECLYKNFNEIKELCKVIKNKDGIIVDELHKTMPLLTKYEKTKVLGMRLKQLNSGCKPYISINEKIIDNNIVALMELEQKVLPFIIQRPIPNNTFEYWKLQDLTIL
jgi:DNA-directed RNA polymerase subunit K/omega